MKHDLLRYLTIGNPVNLIYIDNNGKFTKRRVKLISISDDTVKVYCYTRRAPRSFLIANILAVAPIQHKRKAV